VREVDPVVQPLAELDHPEDEQHEEREHERELDDGLAAFPASRSLVSSGSTVVLHSIPSSPEDPIKVCATAPDAGIPRENHSFLLISLSPSAAASGRRRQAPAGQMRGVRPAEAAGPLCDPAAESY